MVRTPVDGVAPFTSIVVATTLHGCPSLLEATVTACVYSPVPARASPGPSSSGRIGVPEAAVVSG